MVCSHEKYKNRNNTNSCKIWRQIAGSKAAQRQLIDGGKKNGTFFVFFYKSVFLVSFFNQSSDFHEICCTDSAQHKLCCHFVLSHKGVSMTSWQPFCFYKLQISNVLHGFIFRPIILKFQNQIVETNIKIVCKFQHRR